ncbi:MAG: trypsin-like peptidase domain-containing protein, partial [Rhodospirillaceae bacterium]|nr:trypsin-like peptidase domain-containing protein [Rhodospirillaceae bacterium]
MKRTALYSRSTRPVRRPADPAEIMAAATATPPPPPPPTAWEKTKAWLKRHERPALMAAGVTASLAAFGLYELLAPAPQKLTQRDIDAAVLHTLKKQPPEPSRASIAYSVIAPSIVLVRRLGPEGADGAHSDKPGGEPEPSDDPNSLDPKFNIPKPVIPKPLLPGAERAERTDEPDAAPTEDKTKDKAANDKESQSADAGDKAKGDENADDAGKDGEKEELRGLGTGVVFSEDGLIFTCLHVIAGAERIGVTFGDGTESEVDVIDVQPENDLAVLRPKVLPDDLRPATLRSTQGLRVGDEVVAVGFPFGIGPSATSGVVSGLRREHFSEEGQRNLI